MKYIRIVAALFFIHAGVAMSAVPDTEIKNTEVGSRTASFNYMGITGMNSLGTLDGENYSVYLTSTTGFSASSARHDGVYMAEGVGVWEGRIDDEDKALLEQMRVILCREPDWPPMRSPEFMFGYDVVCDGKRVSGAVDTGVRMPEGTSGLLRMYDTLMAHLYAKATHTQVKLDVDYDVTLQGDQFLVTLQFINHGQEELVLHSPGTWEGMFPRPPVPMGTGAELHGNLEFLLGGQQMVNAQEYPDDLMVIPAGQTREARFVAVPRGKGKQGTVMSGGFVAMQVESPSVLGAFIDFRIQERVRDFPRDYPLSPQEWDAWEADYRKRSIIRAGERTGSSVPEDGYYRPSMEVRNGTTIQGRFVTRFQKGDLAPTVTGQVDEHGRPLPTVGIARWTWEADASSVIESGPRQPCPKSGIWLALVPSDVAGSAFFQHDITATVKHGQPMPTVGLADATEESRVRWVWIKPL